MNYSLLPFPFSFYPDSSAHLIRAKTNLSKSNRFHFRWRPMNMVSTSYLWKRPLWTSLETSPTVDNVVFLRMQSDALAWQMHLQSVARCIVEMSWGSRAAQVEPSWQLSPSHVRVLGGYRRALWAMLLFPAWKVSTYLVSLWSTRLDLHVPQGFPLGAGLMPNTTGAPTETFSCIPNIHGPLLLYGYDWFFSGRGNMLS